MSRMSSALLRCKLLLLASSFALWQPLSQPEQPLFFSPGLVRQPLKSPGKTQLSLARHAPWEKSFNTFTSMQH